MTTERANHRGHRWNETNERCVVCLMSRRECDESAELCSREYRSGFTFDLPRKDATPQIEAPPVPEPASSEERS